MRFIAPTRAATMRVNPSPATMTMQESDNPFSEAFGKAVDLGNRIADTDDKADIWDIADGLLAGAVQYWLYSRQPCSDPECEECMPISTAEGRIEELRKLMRQFARRASTSTRRPIATSAAPELHRSHATFVRMSTLRREHFRADFF